jgi:MSHA biogenesis protein MshQ
MKVRGETYSIPGTYIYTVPDGVYSIFVECIGAGGAGGSMNKTQPTVANSNYQPGGGGGGAYAGSTVSVTPGSTYSIVVGAGVAPSLTIQLLSAYLGGSSSFIQGSTTLVMGNGGGSADLQVNWSSPQNGGQKGFALYSIGGIKYDGGYGEGGSQDAPTFNAGGGGGAGGRNGTGLSTIINGTRNYVGGTGNYPGGNGGNGGYYPVSNPIKVGSAGSWPGGGGGAGFTTVYTQVLGGTGGNGAVFLTYTAYKETCRFQLIA